MHASHSRRVPLKLEQPLIRHLHIITEPESKLGGQLAAPAGNRRSEYVLARLGRCWQEQGIRLSTGPVAPPEADLCMLHVDATRVPPHYLPQNPHGRPILNAGALDISKRVVSRHLLARDSGYRGQVIVKTDANCYGGGEFSRLPWYSPRRLRRRLTRMLPWQLAGELPRSNYPVLPGLDAVPEWVWRRDDLVVERFLPEIEQGEYVLRMWMFFGDQEYGVKVYGREPVVKAGNITRHEYLDSVPESLRAMRRELGMDYGKFDYVVVDGEAVLLDANKTPTTGADQPASERLLRVARGLHAFCRDSA